MKTFRNVIMLAAALVLGFTSCNNDDVIIENNGETKTLSFSITQESAPRAEVGKQGATPVVFGGGTLFFTTSSGIIVKKITIGDASADFLVTDATSTTGITIKNVPGTATGATLVGNTNLAILPSGIGQIGGQIQAVKAHAIMVTSQSDITKVNLYGENSAPFVKVGDVYECTINLKPTIARVELSDIVGSEDIASFKVEGIFIDKFYEQAQLGGAVVAGSFKAFAQGATGNNLLFRPGTDGSYNNYAVALYDWYTPALESATNVVVPKTADTVWGYNLFANNSATPQIIIRLSEVYVNERDAEGNFTGNTFLHPNSVGGKSSFVTIKGFVEVNKLTGFEAGYVYTVDADTWAFGPENITEEPDMQSIDVAVRVTVVNWIPKKVTPEL
ncbi:MAG: hypothetical protein LBI15_07815 [Dysgonamonadaceae bacterium]|jgi:hypothetical protein|nr:hypothetical protein [Dysgonamonadaceae bacterium]